MSEEKVAKSYNTSYICQEVHHEWIVAKFGTWGRPAHLIKSAKFAGGRFKGFDLCAVKIRPYPIDLRCPR